MRRSLLVGVVASLAVGGLALPGKAWAGLPHFTGAAPGTATCSATILLHFSPPLTNAGGGTHNKAIGGFVCAPSDGRVSIKSGKLKPSATNTVFTSNGLNCLAPATTGGTFSIYWKGQLNGTYLSQTFAGPAAFSTSDVSVSATQVVTNGAGDEGIELPAATGTSSVTGSFGSPGPSAISGALYTGNTPAQLQAMCAGKGIKKLRLTGSITIG